MTSRSSDSSSRGHADPKGGAGPPGTRWMIWMALAGAPVLYGVVLAVILPGLEITDGPPVPTWVFGVAALVVVWVSTLVRRGLGGSPGQSGGAVVPPAMIASWALDESVAILGLVAAILGASFNTYVPFGVISLGLLWLHRPQG